MKARDTAAAALIMSGASLASLSLLVDVSRAEGTVSTQATGLVAALLPAIPPLPALPVPLPEFPGLMLPDGLLPDFTLELPLPLALQDIVLPPLPLPHNPEVNTIGNCGPAVDLRKRAVFMELNLLPNNQVLTYARAANGSLCQAGIFDTAGASDLAGPGQSGQDPIVASGEYLFVINQGSATSPLGNGSISVMRIEQDGLVLVDHESTQGPNPRSVTRHGDLVYVVNAGFGVGLLGPSLSIIPGTLQGYRFDETTGNLTLLAGSQLRTIDAYGNPAQIGFSPDGHYLVISQRRDTGGFGSGAEPEFLEVVMLGVNGLPVGIRRHDVQVNTPFGFRFDEQSRLYLTHGNFQIANSGAVSSYQLHADGSLTSLTAPTPDAGTDTCWVYISKTTQTPNLYTSAFFDSAVGRWLVNPDGTIQLVDGAAASTADSGGNSYIIDQGGLDLHGTVDYETGAEFVYVLNISDPLPIGLRTSRLVGFRLMPDGALEKLGNELVSGIPNTGFGLWAL